MTEWRIEFEELGTHSKTANVSLPNKKYPTAQAVESAVQKGKIEGVRIRAGSIVLVQKL
jgi:hypothetical protein